MPSLWQAAQSFAAWSSCGRTVFPGWQGALLSYEILIPLTMAGYGLVVGHPQFWPGALVTAFLYIGLALVVSIFTFIILGILPDSLTGWLVTLLPLALSLALLTASDVPDPR